MVLVWELMADARRRAGVVASSPGALAYLIGGHVHSLERSESAWRNWDVGTYAPVKTRNFAILTVES
jgi:hypothetical protein